MCQRANELSHYHLLHKSLLDLLEGEVEAENLSFQINGVSVFEKELDLKDAAQGANLVLMLPYYKHSVFYDCREIEGLRVVSDIQLYLDLYGYPVRGREQAAYLFDKRLKRHLSVNDDE